jgi:hypothetical protein
MVTVNPQPNTYIRNPHFIKYLQRAFQIGTWVATGSSTPMNELKAGLLLLLVCAAFYVLADARIWGGLWQLVGRLVGAH